MLDILDSQKTSEFQEFPNFKGSEYEETKCGYKHKNKLNE